MDTLTARAVAEALWQHLRRGQWTRNRATRTIGAYDGHNPYTPRPKTATVPNASARDNEDVIEDSRCILTAIYPEAHPHLDQAQAIRLSQATYQATVNEADAFARLDWSHALESRTRHLYAYRPNRHGKTRLRAADDPRVTPHVLGIALSLSAVATVQPFDEADAEPAYITEADLAALEDILSTPTQNTV